MQKKQPISIIAISGSIRVQNFTLKALSIVTDELVLLTQNHPIHLKVFDPSLLMQDGLGQKWQEAIAVLQEDVKKATAIILATPEYHGSYSSYMKLIIENLGYPSLLAGKPIVVLGVAAGDIGAIKALEHLRSVCAHIGAIVLPGTVSVAGVREIFNAQGKCLDKNIEQRLRLLAQNLIAYLEKHVCPYDVLEETVRGKTTE